MVGTIRDAFRSDKSAGKWVVVGSVLFCGVVLGLLVWLGLTLATLGNSVKKVDALTYPSPQLVVSRVIGIDYAGPAIRLGDPVVTVGTKCLTISSPIVTFGVTTQSSVEPAGISSTGSIAAALRQPGCVTHRYVNYLDVDVEHRIANVLGQGLAPYVVMRITGFESPVDQHYNSAEWFTQDFRVYPAVR